MPILADGDVRMSTAIEWVVDSTMVYALQLRKYYEHPTLELRTFLSGHYSSRGQHSNPRRGKLTAWLSGGT